MFRCAVLAVRSIRPLSIPYFNAARIIRNDHRGFNTLNKIGCNAIPEVGVSSSLVNNKQILDISRNIVPVPSRTVTKFSLKKGKRKTVKAVIRRFYRLDWGAWIRPRVGRKKRLWTKSGARQRRLRQHLLVNSTQTTLLDKMVTKFWKKPKYYVDDPYAPYHTREEFSITRKKPFQHK
ncbi:39S ribosomal protein L35, mitochondrial [Pectinophora gossypiella]|uniref:39S ribosomal protein L35, mitochondrial n=1 Tax=Pectinophora gossypiella TaxID=13191 RepID=UPI00214F2305|nr:39S ribosomal protein L35, mitochondrial [Pectinophora gossypiella]